MSKTKIAVGGRIEESHMAKRRKLDYDDSRKSDVEIPQTLRDLQWVLTFQQGSPTDLRNGIRSFKALLDSILYDEQNSNKPTQWSILKQYCDQASSQNEDGQIASVFPDVIQTWGFAEQSNNESLLSSVPAVLALFLKTVSTELKFRDFALSLCKFLLQKEQLRLINRGLTAAKVKEHLISPCIRLLTEIVSFDGGAVAKTLFARRDTTLNRIELFLSMRKESTGDLEEDRRKPSVRTNAVRYLLANLRFLSATSKVDIFSQGKIWKACLDDLRADPRDLVVEILSCLEKNVLKDTQLSRQNKGRFLNQWNLPKLATLFTYKKDFELKDDEKPVPELIYGFLRSACTDPGNGVLLTQTGWYPVGSQPEAPNIEEGDENLIDLGLDSPSYVDTYGEEVPVRNSTLAHLIQGLHPENDTLQMDLLISIFEAAPELVAEYFSKIRKFVSEPKETPAWLGQSAFLFSTIQLPVPKNCGWKDHLPPMPPPTSVVIESIVPRPLTRQVITRCLNQSSAIITLYGLRVTRRSLQKLAEVLSVYRSAFKQSSTVWTQASSRLIAEFCRRCPTMRDIITIFQKASKDDLFQREAVLGTLVLYYQVLPQFALEEKFDVSLALVDLLKDITSPEKLGEERESRMSQLNYLLDIAQCSPNVRWWHKPDSLSLTPFSSVLKVLAQGLQDVDVRHIRKVVDSILLDNCIVSDLEYSRDAFFASLQASETWTPGLATFNFLDNCIVRLIQKPVHYSDHLNESRNECGSAGVFSLLLAVAEEQWPFVVAANNDEEEQNIAGWLARLLGYLEQVGDDQKMLSIVRDHIAEATKNKESSSALQKAFKRGRHEKLASWSKDTEMLDSPVCKLSIRDIAHPSLEDVFGSVLPENTSSSGLTRWMKHDLGDSIQQGYVGELMMCFCSEVEEIRRNAYFNARNLMQQLEPSTYTEAKPIYLLLGEVAETAKELLFPIMPYIFGELAARSAQVLANPLHKMYGKVNKYLNRGPVWNVEKIPSYWVDRILLREPEHDDGHPIEANWLLDLLINGLRSIEDMELYRQCNVFERCLSFYVAPGVSRDMKRKILKLVYRSSEVGGSTTLITRTGIMDWIKVQVALRDGHDVILRQLMQHLYDSCDQDRIENWGGKGFAKVVKQMKLE